MTRARENPFSAQRTSALPFLHERSSCEEIIEKLSACHWRGAIVGAHGAGKSTLLRSLCLALEARGIPVARANLRSKNPAGNTMQVVQLLKNIAPRCILVIDGAEQLPRWVFHLLIFSARFFKGILVTSHHQTTLPTLFHCRTSVQLLAKVLNLLNTPLPQRDCEVLFAKYHGDIREILFSLYDRESNRAITGEPNSCCSPTTRAALSKMRESQADFTAR